MTRHRTVAVVLAAAGLAVVGGVAWSPAQPPAAAKPVVYEFRVVGGTNLSDLEANLNRAGAEGWSEVVGTISAGGGLTPGTVVMRRPKR